MDTVTHGITGLVISRILNKNTGKWGIVAGFLAALFPDLDFFLNYINPELYLRYHRGLTTSLVTVLPFCLAISWLMVKISRLDNLREFLYITLAAFIAHIFMDLITSFGTMILAPLSNRRFQLDWVFIIDFWLTGILVAGLILSFIWPGNKAKWGYTELYRWICLASLSLCAGYILLCAVNHRRALSWAGRLKQEHNLRTTQVAALPQPLSPFRWANLVATEDKVYMCFIDLRSGTDHLFRTKINAPTWWRRLAELYRSPAECNCREWPGLSQWPQADQALKTSAGQFFLWFARFPVVKSVRNKDNVQVIRLIDLRFYLMEGWIPFTYQVELDSQGRLVSHGFISD